MSFVVTWLVLGQLAGTVTVSDGSQVRVRSVPDADAAVDVETSPGIGLTVAGRRTSFGFGYSLGIGYADVARSPEMTLSHGATAELAWWSRRLRLTLSENATLGRRVVTAVPPTRVPGSGDAPREPVTVTYLPRAQVLYTGAVTSSLSASYELSRRWGTSASVSYQVGGGIGAEAERALPRYRSVGGEVGVEHALTRRDRVSTGMSTGYTFVPTTGGEFVTVGNLQRWDHTFSSRTEGSLSLGVTWLRSKQRRGQGFDSSGSGAGGAAIAYTQPLGLSSSLELGASVDYGTAYNPVLGVVAQQGSVSGSVGYGSGPFTASASVGMGASFPLDSPTTSRVVSSNVGVGYHVAEPVDVSAGASVLTQVLPGEDAADTPPTWVAFLAVSLHAPILQF